MNPPTSNQVIMDAVNGGYEELTTLKLHFDCPVVWVPAFDRHLKRLPPTNAGESPPPHLTFGGIEVGYDGAKISGMLYEIPPQEGIPGWQRVSFMIYAVKEPHGLENIHTDDDLVTKLDFLRCYEGVVLPGGKMMLGRWWDPMDAGLESGPFIFWAVEGEEA